MHVDASDGAAISRGAVEIAGGRLSYLTAGGAAPGLTILLIHGSGVSARYWINQLRGLAASARVLAVDLPGHGESEPMQAASVEDYAGAVASALDALGAGSVVAAGHSLGGAIAIALAVRRPDSVRGLVLLSSCAKMPDTDGVGERVLAALPGPLRKLVFFSMAKKLLFAPGASGQAVSLGMHELRACRAESILKDLRAAKSMDLTEPAARLDLPALILCGSRDRVTPPALSERLAKLIARSRLRIIEGAGHMLLLEAPDRVNEEILAFVGTAAAPAVAAAAGDKSPTRPLLQRVVDYIRSLLR